MEVPNSVAESQTSDQIQPIDGGDGASEMVGVPADVIGASGGDGGLEVDIVKKKRGRPPRVQAKSPPVKIFKEEDEDVCFICFDGGSLVLCDRRGCPKAYHPACVKRDEAFFQSKAKWTCGWHICSICQKAAHHMCYTCTYSLCKGCIKKADYVCVRGDKGFCVVCLKTIMLIENEGQEKDEKAQVDFDDKTSWEYLFKVYWVYLKRKLSLTLDDLTEAKNPWKLNSTTTLVSPSKCVHNGSNDLKSITNTTTLVSPSTCVNNGSNDVKSITPNMSPQNPEASENKRRKTEEHISIPQKETEITNKPSMVACKNWATKELLDFVAHMKKGDRSMLSQYDVQELMLEYIKINNLRDPRKKSQTICDSRLKILFGKPRVGHFEMLKLLEYHIFIREDLPMNTVTSISKQVDPDWNLDNMVTVVKDKKRRNHKKSEERVPQNKLDEYAAINVHNMNLVYLRRKLMENFIENKEEFDKKVVGSIVRIRISGNDQKHDMYRLVQVVGTSKADAPYKIGDKSVDVVLEVLNLDKKEIVSVDKISNQDLSEDECRRLRQSIRCGLVKRFTVGEIQDKALSLQSVRLNDLMEAETLRLNNLRDRASEKGHKKSLREYVEKLQLLKTSEERERRLREIPEVHSDPKMNPDYETDDTEEYFNKEHEPTKLKYSGISRKNTISSKKHTDFSNNVASRKWKKEEDLGRINIKKDAHRASNGSTIINHKTTESETATTSNSMNNIPVPNYSDVDKVWHYRDPIGKVQGPFCMVQLQKWSTTGYFPQDMRIWMHKENESLILNDVLKEQLHNKTVSDRVGVQIEGLTVQTANLSNMPDMASPTPAGKSADIKNVSSVFDIANADLGDLPSPTPKKTVLEVAKVQTSVGKEQDVGGAQLPKTADEWSGYSPTQIKLKKTVHEDANLQNSVEKEQVASGTQLPKTADVWSGYSPTQVKLKKTAYEDEKVQNAADKDQDAGGTQILKTVDEWSGYSPTQVNETKTHEIAKLQIAVDKEEDVDGAQLPKTADEWNATTNIEQVIPSSSQPVYNNYLQPWQGVRETIEFSTLAEESVSDLLAEVDAMESQNGFPSPTSTRNNFVEDLFNGSFEDFSPTPKCATSSPFSSNGWWPEIPQETTSKDTNNVNNSTKLEADEEERETKTKTGSVQVEEKAAQMGSDHNASETSHDRAGGSVEHTEHECTKSATTKSNDPTPDLVLQQSPPSPPLSLTIGLDKVYPQQGNTNSFQRPVQEITTRVNPQSNTARGTNLGWDPHQRMLVGERYNNNYSLRERSYKVEDSGYIRNAKPWVRQSSFGSGSGGGGGGGGFPRMPPKGLRVCKFYESGRCKKGASCNYWHP